MLHSQVPIYVLIVDFPAGMAVALSNATIVGGCLSNFAMNLGRRHPFRDAPLIDWDLALVSGASAAFSVQHTCPWCRPAPGRWCRHPTLALVPGLSLGGWAL